MSMQTNTVNNTAGNDQPQNTQQQFHGNQKMTLIDYTFMW